jgi:hypothetical protein
MSKKIVLRCPLTHIEEEVDAEVSKCEEEIDALREVLKENPEALTKLENIRVAQEVQFELINYMYEKLEHAKHHYEETDKLYVEADDALVHIRRAWAGFLQALA